MISPETFRQVDMAFQSLNVACQNKKLSLAEVAPLEATRDKLSLWLQVHRKAVNGKEVKNEK